ncbi:MAG: anthranilate synthase component I family protein [Proteobacteria bacterium]|nr:anthranilate synthase component I family protein [Pseudomonadota bacterium]
MSSHFTKTLNWQNPLHIAYALSVDATYNQDWVFLYSGLSEGSNNGHSYLALFPKEQVIADDFAALTQRLAKGGKWFGYLGYGLKDCLEDLPKDQPSFIKLPKLWMVNFHLVLIFDHKKQQIIANYSAESFLQKIPSPVDPTLIKKDAKPLGIEKMQSNFSKKQYLDKLEYIRQRISEGDLYQANLTRKFYSYLQEKEFNKFEIFLKLNQSSPANFSSFIKLGDNYIISSTPELFVKVAADGSVISSPIKGTAPRFSDPKLDQLSKEKLAKSAKEVGENLMIVDLVRNDLSRTCQIDSVKVENLFKITSYKTVHHMSSDICAIKKENFSALDVVKNAFPAGSMTGAPKIKAMEICSELERDERGVYSGAIGFFDGDDDACNLSVVIRTIIIQDNKLEFQVGGAITFDSNAQEEWQETINKAKGVAQALGIELKDLEEL